VAAWQSGVALIGEIGGMAYAQYMARRRREYEIIKIVKRVVKIIA